MIICDQAEGRFQVRIVGVAFRGGDVLLERASTDQFWTLPGGRLEMGETTQACIRREMQEEIGVDVQVGRLLWVVENFFEYDKRQYHEMSLYYLLSLPDACRPLVLDEFESHDRDAVLRFRWFDLNSLDQVCVLPSFLTAKLRSLPSHPVHIVHRGA